MIAAVESKFKLVQAYLYPGAGTFKETVLLLSEAEYKMLETNLLNWRKEHQTHHIEAT